MGNIEVSQSVANQLRILKLYRRGETSNPHKYILLLAVISLFDHDDNHDNQFTYKELDSIFSEYFNRMFPEFPPYRRMMEYPFYHMQTDGLWRLQIRPGLEKKYKDYEALRLTKKRLLETVDYAVLDPKIFELLNSKTQRELIRGEIMTILTELGAENLNTHADEPQESPVVHETASLYEHERVAIEDLKRFTRQHQIGEVMSNILIFDNQSKTYLEYDVVIVAHSGIHVVELKHWSGHIEIAPYNWIINHSSYRRDPRQLNEFKCKVLRGLYQHQFRTYPEIWIESIVALTNPDAVVENADAPTIAAGEVQRSHTFASIVDLITYLKQREAEPHLLATKQVDAVSGYISSLHQPRRNVYYTVPGYETIEYHHQTAEYIELLARLKDPQARGLFRFRVFRPSALNSFSERQQFQVKALNTLKSVQLIGDHPNIHRVWMNESSEGDIIEGSEWSESGTLRDLIHQQDKPLLIQDVFAICRGIAQGLVQAHKSNIIHRAVRPENILMVNGVPRLMNFDLSYHLEDNRVTVMPDVVKLKDDGYIAPEILAGEDIDESTDFFGLGELACELLGGVKPFASVKQLRSQGGKLSQQFILLMKDRGVPEKTVEALSQLVVAERKQRLKDPVRIQAAFTLQEEEKNLSIVTEGENNILLPGSMHDGYEILDFIGKGAAAQIYKARTIRGGIVAIKMFNREVPRERILKEADVGERVKSDYVAHVINVGHWKQDRYYLVMDYIEGESLRKRIDQGVRPDFDLFLSVSRWLMEGLQSFHSNVDESGIPKPLVHGDIKPENVLLTPDHKPVLIDFGISGEPRIDLFQGTVGYVPPDSILGSEMQFSESGDIFALGVVMWEWLFGNRPYEHPAIGEQPSMNEKSELKLVPKLILWLKKTVATEATQRYESVNVMQDELEEALRASDDHEVPEPEDQLTFDEPTIDLEVTESLVSTVKTPQINSFVSYLNSLSNASAGNENATAEAQIGNIHFDRIRVDNPVTEFIIERLKEQNVILTGNAGDGKTTIASEVAKRITGKYSPLKPREDLAEGNLVIIKDLSEVPENERSKVFIEALQNPHKRFLIVSNTGTLLNNMKGLNTGRDTVDENTLLQVLESDAPQNLAGDSFLVVNVGRLNGIRPAMQVFHKMIKSANWAVCRDCSCVDNCSINLNVKVLQEGEEVVSERTRLLYQRLYEYGSRLTMRQMTGHLAFAITGGLGCRQIGAMSNIARQESLNSFLFHNLIFGDDGIDEIPEAMQLVPVLQIRQEEFGIVLDPYFERKLWNYQGNHFSLNGDTSHRIMASLREQINGSARNQIRRLAFFWADLSDESGRCYLQTFLNSPLLLTYLNFTQNSKSIPALKEDHFRHYVLQVLQEFFTGVRLPEGQWRSRDLYITLRPGAGKSATQMIIADIPCDKFRVQVIKRYSFSDVESNCLALIVPDTSVKLILDLPFLDYVIRRFEGHVAEALTAFYAYRLERFKARLLECYATPAVDEGSLRLLRIGRDRNFQLMRVIFSGDQLEVVS